MPTYTANLQDGVNAVPGYGDRWEVGFAGTWVAGDTYSVTLTATDATLGYAVGVGTFGQLHNTATFCVTFSERVYLGMQSQFSFSDNLNPTAWQLPAPGAGFVSYLSRFGSQDDIIAIGQMQGRLIVFGRRSIEIWTVDADPNNFALVQTLDNVGTVAPLSVVNLGDLDLLFLDDTGIRSLRARETTLNAYPDDIGSPVDLLVKQLLQGIDPTTCVGICEPSTRNYWLYINGTILVLTRKITSKVTAWSTFSPTYDNGSGQQIAFVPEKFVSFDGLVYARGSLGEFITYGGATGAQYDGCVATVELPWLDDKKPGVNKVGDGVGFVISGMWNVSVGMNPQGGGFTAIPPFGSPTTPNEPLDSSYDSGRLSLSMIGTHFKFKATSDPSCRQKATLSSLVFYYNTAEIA